LKIQLSPKGIKDNKMKEQLSSKEIGDNEMMIQISSGQGPVECELAVGKFLESLQAEYPDIRIHSSVPGSSKDSFKSILLGSEEDLSHLEGSIQWICQSPCRPHHKRKNWYIDVSLVKQAVSQKFDDNLVRFETFRSSGKGGQHVNKVETGVRAVYVPLGMSVESTEARSQHMNKKLALNRLCALIADMNHKCEADVARLNRLEHTRLERGNPVRVYEGKDFKRVV
jgi:peptide chain release factor